MRDLQHNTGSPFVACGFDHPIQRTRRFFELTFDGIGRFQGHRHNNLDEIGMAHARLNLGRAEDNLLTGVPDGVQQNIRCVPGDFLLRKLA